MKEEYLQGVLNCYEKYYEVKEEGDKNNSATFFHSNGEKYILVKKVKMAVKGTNESVYFTTGEIETKKEFLDIAENVYKEEFQELSENGNYTNSAITLVIINNHFAHEVLAAVKKYKGKKRTKFTLGKWINYKIVAIDLSDGEVTTNAIGKDLVKIYEENLRNAELNK